MKKYFFLIFILFIAQNSLAADDKKNNLQMMNSLSFTNGEAFGSKNQKEAFNSLVEYPLSNKMSVGATLQASQINSNYQGNSPQQSDAIALNSVEAFHRYKFLTYDKFGFTLQNSFKFLGIYQENKHLGLMPQQQDYELRLLTAYNMQDRLVNNILYGTNPYWARFEIAYRKRFSNPFDEFRARLWVGINLTQKFEFLFQDDMIWNVTAKASTTNNSYSNLANFSAKKDANNMGTFSLIYRLNDKVALQTGYVRRLRGNNPFYDYQGVTIGLWTSF